MTSARIRRWETYAYADPLFQWDYGQILRVYLDEEGLTGNAEMHFTTKGRSDSDIVIAQCGDGYVEGEIPNCLLEVGKDIRAYLYIASASEGKTIKEITIPVNSREKPDDYSEQNGENILRKLMEIKADNLAIKDEYLQLMSAGRLIGERVRLPTAEGTREIELKNDGTAIKWRYTDSNEWKELIKLEDIRGKDGQTPEFEIREGHLYAIYNE